MHRQLLDVQGAVDRLGEHVRDRNLADAARQQPQARASDRLAVLDATTSRPLGGSKSSLGSSRSAASTSAGVADRPWKRPTTSSMHAHNAQRATALLGLTCSSTVMAEDGPTTKSVTGASSRRKGNADALSASADALYSKGVEAAHERGEGDDGELADRWPYISLHVALDTHARRGEPSGSGPWRLS